MTEVEIWRFLFFCASFSGAIYYLVRLSERLSEEARKEQQEQQR